MPLQKQRFCAFVLFFCFTTEVYANYSCLPKIETSRVSEILDRTRKIYFPELENKTIVLSTFESNDYFFQARPLILSLLNPLVDTQYTIELNLKLLSCPPSEDSLEAILVHELMHIKDYSGWSSSELAIHGLKYLAFFKFKVDYERQTDKKALKKGISNGLANYRKWVYQRLSASALKEKRLIYLTPEEIKK